MNKQISQLHVSVLALKNELEALRDQFMASLEMNEILMMMLMPEDFMEKQAHPEYTPVPTSAFHDPSYSPSRLP
jgi:hypothetical protein